MAQTVDVINSMTTTDSTSAVTLADTILQDYGLTQKLLRMVNTLGYSQYGEVTTVTRAVLLMGFERVRSVATSLIIFEHFRKHAQGAPLIELINKAFCSAVVCRSFAQSTGVADPEEAFLGALYHRLGQVLVAFYLPHYYAAIESAPAGERERKIIELLGVGFDSVGAAIARALHLPERLQQAIAPRPAEVPRGNISAAERLNCLAVVSNTLTDLMTAGGDVATRRAEMEAIVAAYNDQIKFKGELAPFLASVVTEVRQSSVAFRLKLQGTRMMVRIGQFGAARAPRSGPAAVASGSKDLLADNEADVEQLTPASAETILTQGLHEVMSLLVGDYAFDDVLRVVLETIYRALGVGRSRVLFLLKDPARPVAHFRYGFGHAPDEAALWAEVPISGSTDFISQAVTLDKDIIIRNARSPSVAQALPGWLLRKGVLDRYLVLLPLTVEHRPVGLFYIDGEKDAGGVLTPTIINHLKLLRGQVVVAIRRRAGGGTTAKS